MTSSHCACIIIHDIKENPSSGTMQADNRDVRSTGIGSKCYKSPRVTQDESQCQCWGPIGVGQF
jgi:hypothetical protein